MLRCNYHKGSAEHRIAARSVNAESIVSTVNNEIDKGSLRASDPIFLLESDIWKIIHLVKPFKKLIGIFGNAEIPYIL